jgi:hypothetical protein
MTAADDDQTDSGPGFALPHEAGESSVPEPTNIDPGTSSAPQSDSEETPLTETQQAVVDHISGAQQQLGKADRFRNTPGLGLWGSGVGAGFVLGAIDRDLHMHRVSDEDDAALFLAEQTHAGDSGSPRHVVPDGGPPTPEEVHEAEMNPWPHHNMAETIEHNRQLRSSGQAEPGAVGNSGSAGNSE